MNASATLSRRPLRRFWGWGQADARLDARELATVKTMVEHLDVPFEERPVPQVAEFALRALASNRQRRSRPCFPGAARSPQPQRRQELRDLARMWLREPPAMPDWSYSPDDEQAIVDLLDWAQANNVAWFPMGRQQRVRRCRARRGR